MRLRLHLVVYSVIVSLPVALATVMIVNWLRARDQTATVERITSSMLTHHVRVACESDPNWFLAGPREAPPTMEERAMPDAETRLPRPSSDTLPLEFYAYDDQYQASSSAAPRFPVDFRAAMRSVPPAKSVVGPFNGGMQMARATGWNPGPCSVLLVRWRTLPGGTLRSVSLFLGLFVAGVGIGYAVAGPIVMRIRRLATVTRESARQDYSVPAPVHGTDEISSLGAMFNEVGADIRRRIADSKDREEALRRYVADVTDGVSTPLSDLEARLASASAHGGVDPSLVRRAHELAGRLLNLEAVARLRTSRERLTREPVDMNAVVHRVIATLEPLAAASGVTLTPALPKTPAVIAGDPVLFERAVTNLVENGILYNQPGGRVTIEIAQYDKHGQFSLRVTDTGRGVSDEEFTGLTAIRRFRGDEGRDKRAGVPGLGLAVTREIVERYGYGLELRRPAAGGFEVDWSGRGTEA